jgi:hypothetical protein
MTIYQRTTEGQWAAYSVESPLPRKLKILLKSIDGRVPEEVYLVNLKSFGDVHEILQSLVQSGLIEDVATAQAHPKQEIKQEIKSKEPEPAPVEIKPRHMAQLIRLADVVSPEAHALAKPSDPSMDEWTLDVATQFMSNFLLTHMPENAFQVLPEIESLKSMDQLKVMIDGYAQLVAGTGEVGKTHVAELRSLFETNQDMNAVPHQKGYA